MRSWTSSRSNSAIEAGMLMSGGPAVSWCRLPSADLPVEQPTKFELINRTNRWRFAYSNALPVDGPGASTRCRALTSTQWNLCQSLKRSALRSWIVAQHRAGIAVPVVDGSVLDDIKRGRDMPFSERVDRALLFLSART